MKNIFHGYPFSLFFDVKLKLFFEIISVILRKAFEKLFQSMDRS